MHCEYPWMSGRIQLVILSLDRDSKKIYNSVRSKRSRLFATRRVNLSCGVSIRRSWNKSVMLPHTSHASWVMQNVHEKSSNLPDPDIFAFDTRPRWSKACSHFCSRRAPIQCKSTRIAIVHIQTLFLTSIRITNFISHAEEICIAFIRVRYFCSS